MTVVLSIGVLTAAGVYLIAHRELIRVIVGFVLLGHAVNLLLLAAGGLDRREPPLGAAADPASTADPLPQAFVLTAVVITFGITVYLLGLARAGADDEAGRPAADEADAVEATGADEIDEATVEPADIGESGVRSARPDTVPRRATGGQDPVPDGTRGEGA